MAYSVAELKALLAKGETMPDMSYPVANKADLQNAIHAVGRSGDSHNAVRKYLIGRAKALGASDMIPGDWNADGSMSAPRSAVVPAGAIVYRSIGLDVELRSGGDGRTLEGILVPYSKPTRIDNSLVEEFVPGAFAAQVRAMTPGRLNDPGTPRIPLCRDHIPLGGQIIGRVTGLREDALGLRGTARISNTTAGNDTLALLNDGVLSDWSIGFRMIQNRSSGAVTQRIQSHLTELAIVPQGAYGSLASVGAIRAANGQLTCGSCGQYMSVTDAAAHVIDGAAHAVETNDSAAEQESGAVESNAQQAARLIASLPLLGLKGPVGAPGGPAMNPGSAATYSP